MLTKPWWSTTDPVKPGFWIVRCRLPTKTLPRELGPSCPAAIILLRTAREPGVPENEMERSPFYAAFVSGQPVGVWDLQPSTHTAPRHIFRREKEISRAEYLGLLQTLRADQSAGRYNPANYPFNKIETRAMELPFARPQ